MSNVIDLDAARLARAKRAEEADPVLSYQKAMKTYYTTPLPPHYRKAADRVLVIHKHKMEAPCLNKSETDG